MPDFKYIFVLIKKNVVKSIKNLSALVNKKVDRNNKEEILPKHNSENTVKTIFKIVFFKKRKSSIMEKALVSKTYKEIERAHAKHHFSIN